MSLVFVVDSVKIMMIVNSKVRIFFIRSNIVQRLTFVYRWDNAQTSQIARIHGITFRAIHVTEIFNVIMDSVKKYAIRRGREKIEIRTVERQYKQLDTTHKNQTDHDLMGVLIWKKEPRTLKCAVWCEASG